MASSPSLNGSHQNRLLSLLTNDVRQQMLPMLHHVKLTTGEFLTQANQPVSTVYFPLSSVSSSVKSVEGGVTIEVATVGNEGFVGLPLVLGSESDLVDSIVQIDGEAPRMSAKDFVQTLASSDGLRISHTIEKRCARWILMTQDRVGEASFMLSHHDLSFMLAATQESVPLRPHGKTQSSITDTESRCVTVSDSKGPVATATG
jgi:CRP-like cAMP-binding protein